MSKLNAFIAIPSHKRSRLLQSATLSLLKSHRVSMSQVYVFSSKVSYNSYSAIANDWGFQLVESYDSILETRNHIISFFPSGTAVIEIDDDVTDICVTIKHKKVKSVLSLVELFNESFRMIKGRGLWGFNATANNFFSVSSDKHGLYSIVNSCLGYINDKRIKLTVPEKEDFERCIQFYQLRLPILKRGCYGIKTRYWRNSGGLQDKYNFETRREIQKYSAEQLCRKYCWAVYTRSRKNGLVDIRFKKDPLGLYTLNLSSKNQIT